MHEFRSREHLRVGSAKSELRELEFKLERARVVIRALAGFTVSQANFAKGIERPYRGKAEAEKVLESLRDSLDEWL